MNVTSIRRLLPLVYVLIGICLVETVIYANQRSPSERVCDNLVRAKLLVLEDDCFVSDNYGADFARYFPEGMVDRGYVMTAMQGFKVVNDVMIDPAGCHNGNYCSFLEYRTINRLLFDATYEFVFVDGALSEHVSHD